MSTLTYAPLASVITEAKSGFACGNEDPDGIFQIRMNNVTRAGGLDLTKRRRIPAAHKSIKVSTLSSEDVLFNATNSPDLVGKTAIFSGVDELTTFSNHFLRLRTNQDLLLPRYLAHWLQAQFRIGVFRSLCRQWVNQATVSKDSLLGLTIPLPVIEEQRRIAQVLDDVDTLRAKRGGAIALLDDLSQSIFLDMFGNVAINDRNWDTSLTLGKVSSVSSGITKGRKLANSSLRSIPYMTVLNVQERRLALDTVKTIEASEDEIQRYRLRKDDLLLTEGGDPDKLGRGTLWRNEIPECIHQNHIFRVRLHQGANIIDPVFLNWLVASKRGRRYFLRSAKQTTGIASINAAQLKEFPLLTPPIEMQRKFAQRLADVEQHKASHTAHLAELDALFVSLQDRAFRGKLWDTTAT